VFTVHASDCAVSEGVQAPAWHVEVVTVRVRVPEPLQVAPSTQSPQVPSTTVPQAAPSGWKVSGGHAVEVPSQDSGTSHAVAAGRQPAPAGLGTHVPSWPGALQVAHGASQAVVQQVPSTQWPLPQSAPAEHGVPGAAFGVQAPFAQR
jgi:hypothetical protein